MIPIDFSNMTMIAFHSALKHAEPTFENVRRRVIKELQHIKTLQNKYGKIIICCDGRKPYWRSKVNKFYKMNRTPSQYSSEFGNITHQLRKEFRKYLPYPLIKIPHIEADDIIAMIVKKLKPPHLIYSNDSDFYQLLDKDNDIIQFTRSDGPKMLTKIEAQDSLNEKIVTGDRSDGICNIRSDENTFMKDYKRQTPIRKKDIGKLIKEAPNDPNLKRRYKQNRAIIDFNYIPKKIRIKIRDAYMKSRKRKKKSMAAYLKRIGDHHLLPTRTL